MIIDLECVILHNNHMLPQKHVSYTSLHCIYMHVMHGCALIVYGGVNTYNYIYIYVCAHDLLIYQTDMIYR